MEFVCVDDFEKVAQSVLPKSSWDYYSSGATTQHSLKDNMEAYSRYIIRPRVLVDVSEVDMKTTILGHTIEFPIGVSPTAMQCLAHHEGERATARATARMNTCMTLSSWSNTSLEDVAAQNGSHLRWFQLYVYADKQLTFDLVQRAERSGYRALAVTVDTPEVGIWYNNFYKFFTLPPHLELPHFTHGLTESYPSLTWKEIDWLSSITRLPIVVKGILTAEDAKEALNHHVQGIIVSNHGARQLDGVPATIDVLPEIVRAVNGQLEVYVDGGIRHGTDVLKALSLGAQAVFIGRPILWGLAVNGEEGVYQVLSLLKEELRQAMVLSGCPNIAAIKSSTDLVVHRTHYNTIAAKLGDVSFGTKAYRPDKNCHGRELSADELKQEVLQNPRLKSLMKEISSELEIEDKTVLKTAEEIVDEIGHKMSLPAVRTLAMVLRGTIRRIIRGIYLEKEGLERLRSAVRTHPVIILPSHRSYLDFILISYFMLELDIQLPAIAAGQDFMNMKFVSSLLRRSGAFFMRRTFGSDRLYKLIFSLYLQALLCSRDTPVEFFIEGTRSRTAKSLHPKLGLLSMIVEPYLHGALPDILLFPISISYERTLEESLFAHELLGIPKPKESTSGLLKARGLLSSDYGSIYVNFPQPISLHDVCQRWGISRIPHGLQPKSGFILLPEEREMVTKLGHLVLGRIEKGMRVFPLSLLAAVMLQHSLEGIKRDKLTYWMRLLKREIENRGGVVHWEGEDCHVIDDALSLLSSGECIIVRPSSETVQVSVQTSIHHSAINCSIHDMKKVSLSPLELSAIMDVAYIHLKLAHYRNQLLHWFIPEAMILLCLVRVPELVLDELKIKYLSLWTALSREFVLPETSPQLLLDKTLYSLTDRGIIDINGSTVYIAPFEQQEDIASLLAKLIEPFVAGVWVMCLYLESLMGGVQTLKLTLKNTQLFGAKLIQKGILLFYEPLSLDVYKNAITSLNEAGLLFEPELEFEGRDRLVKVANSTKLRELTIKLGSILFNDTPVSIAGPSKI